MRRVLVACLWLAALGGAGLLVWGVVYDVVFVNMPAQDATQEVHQKWRAQARTAEQLRGAGGALAMGGGGLLMIVRQWQRKWRPKRGPRPGSGQPR